MHGESLVDRGQLYLATGTYLGWQLRAFLDGEYVACGCGAEVGKRGASPKYQELEQQTPLGEWSCECLEELALKWVVRRRCIGTVQVPLPSCVANILQIKVDALVAILGHHSTSGPGGSACCNSAR